MCVCVCVCRPVDLRALLAVCVCASVWAGWGSEPMKGPTAGIHEYFNILASSHIAFCQAPIPSPVTHDEREEKRGRRKANVTRNEQ